MREREEKTGKRRVVFCRETCSLRYVWGDLLKKSPLFRKKEGVFARRAIAERFLGVRVCMRAAQSKNIII